MTPQDYGQFESKRWLILDAADRLESAADQAVGGARGIQDFQRSFRGGITCRIFRSIKVGVHRKSGNMNSGLGDAVG